MNKYFLIMLIIISSCGEKKDIKKANINAFSEIIREFESETRVVDTSQREPECNPVILDTIRKNPLLIIRAKRDRNPKLKFDPWAYDWEVFHVIDRRTNIELYRTGTFEYQHKTRSFWPSKIEILAIQKKRGYPVFIDPRTMEIKLADSSDIAEHHLLGAMLGTGRKLKNINDWVRKNKKNLKKLAFAMKIDEYVPKNEPPE